MELLISPQMKFENISEFSLIILVGIFEYWDDLFSFNSLISVSISLKLTSLKLKAPFLLHLVLIARMLGCFYLRIAFKVKSLTFSLIGNVKILYNITKKIVKSLSCFFFSFHNFTIFTQTYPFSGIEFLG